MTLRSKIETKKNHVSVSSRVIRSAMQTRLSLKTANAGIKKVTTPPPTGRKSIDIYKYANQNVVYLAYVGKYNDKDIYKYGISSNIHNRVYLQHMKQFEQFDLRWVKKSYNNSQAESLFEKELKIKGIHTELVINNKKQTELFYVSPDLTFENIRKLYSKVTDYADKDILEEISTLKQQIKEKDDLIRILLCKK